MFSGTGIALGVTIGGLTAQSCDASWIPGSTSWNLSDASFKLMELDGLSVYWNETKKEDMFHDLDLQDLAVNTTVTFLLLTYFINVCNINIQLIFRSL